MLAARVDSPSLAEALADETTRAQLRAGLAEHGVLVFRGADPTSEQLIDLASVFGPIEPPEDYNPAHPDHPEICVFDSTGGYKADKWHADVTWKDQPPAGAVLTVRTRPAAGGDTVWANVAAAYDALSSGMKGLLEGRRARHDIGPDHGTEHPVVRVHPDTGRSILYVNDIFTRSIVNLPDAEGEVILAFLKRHVGRPEFTYRHTWGDGDVVVWDNRTTQHYALFDFEGQRVVNRVGFLGTPFA